MIEEKILDISWKTIMKVVLIVIAFYITYTVRDLLVWFIFALIISILFNPAIDFLQKKRVPRVLGALLVYCTVFGLFSLMLWLAIPMFVVEIKQFIRMFPQYFAKISPPLQGLGFQAFENIDTFLKSLGDNLEAIAGSIFNILFAVFGGIFSTLFVITTAIFISVEEKIIDNLLILIFPKKYEVFALNLWHRAQKKVTGWFLSRVLVCVFVGLASFIVFLIFNVKYPVTLGLLAGVLNFIPYLGPLFTTILLFLVIFPVNILKAIFVLIAFGLIQEIDGKILSPILMKKIINVPPVLVLISLVIGAQLWGFLGSLLVVPLAGILFEFTKEFLQKRKEREAGDA